MAETLLTRTQRAAADFLEGSLSAREPLAALSGPAGTGKTVTLNLVLDTREGSGARIIRINNFVAGPLSLHRVLAAALGVAEAGELSPEQLEPMLRKALADDGQAEPPIVAVDDAQSLLPETLRYLCLMAGLREAGWPLFRILLVGRPGFTLREAIPSQFVLEPMRADDSRQFLTSQLAQAGMTLPDDVVEPMVQQGQGNLRKLAALLAVRNASGERLPKRPSKPEPAKMPTVGTVPAAAAPSRAAPAASGTRSGSSTAVPGKGGLGNLGMSILGVTSPGLVVAAPAAVVALAVVGVLVFRAAPSHRPVAAPQPQAVAAVKTEPSPRAETPQVEAAKPATPPTITEPARPVASAPPQAAEPQVAEPQVAEPQVAEPPATLPPPSPAPAPAPAPVAAPVPQASAPTRQTGDVAGALTQYRVYNISQCHHTMCPRWSVTDMSKQSRFVAAFDLNTLHLNPALALHIREGAIDIIVNGSVSDPDGNGRVLQATSLEATVAHHGRYVASSDHADEQASPGQSAATPASQSPSQSPPPGFLAFPATRQPVQEAPLNAPPH